MAGEGKGEARAVNLNKEKTTQENSHRESPRKSKRKKTQEDKYIKLNRVKREISMGLVGEMDT